MQQERPIVLTIAGFDPCGGAGVLADIKTAEQLQVQGMAVITANTIQTGDSFVHIDWQPIDIVLKGIQTLMSSYKIDVVKIGIVRDFGFLRAITDRVKSLNENAFIIWDTIIKSSSGFSFFKEEDMPLLPKVLNSIDLLTPNFIEYNLLKPFISSDFANAVLVKGGHREDDKGTDILMQNGKAFIIHSLAQDVFPKHGSGCVLSSAVAAGIALGKPPEDACRLAKRYAENFLNSNSSLIGYHYDAG